MVVDLSKNRVSNFAKQQNIGAKHLVDFKASTFLPVRDSKTAPVQEHMDKELPHIIGTSFLFISYDKQVTTDQNTGEAQNSTVYTVRVISKKAQAFRDLIQIKVKNSEPIITEEEMDKVMMQIEKPIILRFDDIAHYAYMGGETLNATKVEKLNISVQEAMNHE